MERTPSPGPYHYNCSLNPSDSSDDSKKTVSANLVIPNDQEDEVDSCRVVSPAGEEDGTSDSERTVSFKGIPCDGYGDVMEADSGHCKAEASFLQKKEKHTRLKTDKAKSVVPDQRQQVIALQPKRGLLKMLPENKVVRGTGDSSILSKNSETEGVTIDGNILLTDTKMVIPLPRVQDRKEYLPVPKWLKDYKSNVADSDGWRHFQVPRQGSHAQDKYYTHKDYDNTFRSKNEVRHFLDTGEVKGKGLLQKKSSDPCEPSSGPRRSTKRRMVPAASGPVRKPQGYGSSTGGEMLPRSSKLPLGFV
ncbi:unnamed protein product [Urochloa decumbens]|uniref:MBD domain-containing protein n=1 Tax=Urochloa decumbens TaxID=240449 RepID=A0ABC9E7U9_9POAL